jgi:hypothetical protein
MTNADYMDDGSGLNQLYNEQLWLGCTGYLNSLSGPQFALTVFNENFEANVTSNVAILMTLMAMQVLLNKELVPCNGWHSIIRSNRCPIG